VTLKQTAAQTIGPFFAYCLVPESFGHKGIAGPVLHGPGVAGEKIRIAGRLFDGAGAPIADALVEIWQADAEGRYASAPGGGGFTGFGRAGTDAEGRYSFSTIKPGAVAGPNGKAQAPHILIAVYARGLPRHAYTRIYFADEAGNAADPILNLVPADRRKTLIAPRAEKGGQLIYAFDIKLQGENETVFFDV
jgi:protocatechuate 3,4-dioxygenase alpha subunit